VRLLLYLRFRNLPGKLILNDRDYIEYMKRRDHRNISKELEPFSRFWESEEHMKRVEEFLNRMNS